MRTMSVSWHNRKRGPMTSRDPEMSEWWLQCAYRAHYLENSWRC